MRTFLSILLCIPPMVGFSQSGLRNPAFVASLGGTTVPIVYLIRENFEGAGFETTSPNAWSIDSGNVDSDSGGFVTLGSQSAAVQRISGTSKASLYWTNSSGPTNVTQVGGFFSLAVTRTNANFSVLNLQTNGTVKNIIQVRSTGQLRLTSSDSLNNATTSDVIGTNQQVYVWWYVNNGTGVGNIEWSTTLTRAGSGTKYASYSGAQTGMALNQLALIADATLCTNYFDYLRVATSGLSSSPE